MNIKNTSKFISISIILIVTAFLINNYLTFAGDWPGAFTLDRSINVYSLIQFLLYIFAVLAPLVFVYEYMHRFWEGGGVNMMKNLTN